MTERASTILLDPEAVQNLKGVITERFKAAKTPEKQKGESRNALALAFALVTDASTRELINLKFSDFENDGQNPTVTLTNKAMRHRQIPISIDLAEAVSTFRRKRKADDNEHVFANLRKNAPFATPNTFSLVINDYIEGILGKRVGLQTLRETYRQQPQNNRIQVSVPTSRI